MSKANGTINTIGKIITYILVVLLILGIAGGISYFVLRKQGITYYVEYGGEKYLADSDGGSLYLPPSDKPQTFAVKSLTGGEVNFDVKITSNSANNFTFVYDGEPHKFYGTDEEQNDYSEVFGVEKSADGFTLSIPENFTVEKVIETKYGGDIEIQGDLNHNLCYFVITVSVDKTTVNLWFNFTELTITLDPPSIIF